MKALSLAQPWANVILHLGKRIENRDWTGCSYRGPVLLHASKSVGTRDQFDDSVEGIMNLLNPAPGAERLAVAKVLCARERHLRWTPEPDMPRGAIVGRATIIGTIRDEHQFARAAADTSNTETHAGDWATQQRRWWFGGFALVLADVRPVPPIPCKGALGLWNAGPDIVARLPEAVRAQHAIKASP